MFPELRVQSQCHPCGSCISCVSPHCSLTAGLIASRGVCDTGEVRAIHTRPHVSTVLREQLCFLPRRDISLFAAFFEIFWIFVRFPGSCFSPTSRISSKKEKWLVFFSFTLSELVVFSMIYLLKNSHNNEWSNSSSLIFTNSKIYWQWNRLCPWKKLRLKTKSAFCWE